MRRSYFAIVIIIAILLTQWSRLGSIGSYGEPFLNTNGYYQYSGDFRFLTIFIALSLFLAAVFLPGLSSRAEPSPDASRKNIRAWAFSFTVLIAAAILLVLYVNPEGRYPFNKRDEYISIAARSIKPDLYRKLERTPDLVIFGSSASFTIPAAYLKEEMNLDAFNMSLNGGGPVDFITMINFMLKESPDQKVPAIFTVELLAPGLGLSNPTQTPLEQIPYMELDQAIPAAAADADHAVKLTSVSDSIFTLMYLDQNRWNARVRFAKDGTGIRFRKDASTEQYQSNVRGNVRLARSLLSCKELDPEGMEYIGKMIELSNQHRFSIVFYLHPYNSDFYTEAHVKPSAFASCRNLLGEYIGALTEKYTNIFFVDLSRYEPIIDGGKEVFVDTHHLTEHGSILLLEALKGTIQEAAEWTREHR